MEVTGPLACLLWGLDERTWCAADARDWGLWCSVSRWRALLAAVGLRVVVEHRRAAALAQPFTTRNHTYEATDIRFAVRRCCLRQGAAAEDACKSRCRD